MDDNDAVLITIPTAARRLSLSRSTIYLLVRQGILRTVKVGRSVRLLATDVREFAEGLTETVR